MANTSSWKREEEIDEEEEEEEIDETAFELKIVFQTYKTLKDAVLFAIDVSPSMLTPPEATGSKKSDLSTPTIAALKCAYHLMQKRIISNPDDMIGVLLFGTEKSKFYGQDNSSPGNVSYPHCYLLTDLDVPAAEDVKTLRAFIEDQDESKALLKVSKEPVSMSNMLFCANQIFTTKAPNILSRRLFLVTDEDEPHSQDKAMRSAATVRAKDLYDLGIFIELFPISTGGRKFDRGKFYDDVIYRLSTTDPNSPVPLAGPTKAIGTSDGISLLNSLLSSINSKAVARRALFSNVLELSPGLRISVKGYILFKRQKPARSCYVWLSGEKALIAKGSTTHIASEDFENLRIVDKDEIKKAYKFGGDQVVFTKAELASLRHFEDPIIRIIGFKPLSMLPIWASLKQSTFIYPSEEGYLGSTRVFSALYQKLLNDDKMAIVWFVARKNAAPAIAAMIAGPEQFGDEDEQIIPPGMWLIPLPFADDIRKNPDTTVIKSPNSLTDLMRVVVQQLMLPKGKFNPQKYPNPALQWHYRILQALALDEDIPTQPEDKTVPRYRQIEKRTGDYVHQWCEELESQSNAWQQDNVGIVTGSKRGASAVAETNLVKRAKIPTANNGKVDDSAMRGHWKANTIKNLTIPLLKGWMEAHHLSTAGKKADLVERIEEWFETKE
ncbi:MAG: ATP-dependent DNA helicase II subunit 1 [Trizodia sp. TS-e1964]|nr:MAG: ATP-dependent DNA helicase II subunit 1 [Trizodia sp. TS-e1964]